jgi:DNA-binding NtrC family response regulator
VLASRFAQRFCAANGLPPDAKVFAPDAINRMLTYPWPGNIRELESTVSRAALTSPGRVIRDTDLEFLHPHTASHADSSPRLPTLADAERAHIVRVLEAVGWNKKEAARVLDISRGTLYRKILEYGLDPERTKQSA